MERKLTDQQIKGVDLSVRALKKVYNFITGWKLSKGWEKYESHLYIDLYIDYNKLDDLFKLGISESFRTRLERGEEIQSSAILSPFSWGDYGTEEFEKMGDLSFSFGRKINDTLNQAYEYVPDEMKIYWRTGSGNKYESKLSIDSYFYQL